MPTTHEVWWPAAQEPRCSSKLVRVAWGMLLKTVKLGLVSLVELAPMLGNFLGLVISVRSISLISLWSKLPLELTYLWSQRWQLG